MIEGLSEATQAAQRLTEVGQSLARRAARIEVGLADAARELAEAATGRAGVVRVGDVNRDGTEDVLLAGMKGLGFTVKPFPVDPDFKLVSHVL